MQLLCEMALSGLGRTYCLCTQASCLQRSWTRCFFGAWCTGACYLESIGGSNSVRQLCGQRRGDGVKVELLAAVVYWHLPSFAMPMLVPIALSSDARRLVSAHAEEGSSDQWCCADLMCHLLNGVPPPHHHSMLSVLSKNLCACAPHHKCKTQVVSSVPHLQPAYFATQLV